MRKDDDPEVFKTRLAAYRAQTAPVSAWYKAKGRLVELDGMRAIAEVSGAIDQALAAAVG